MDCTAELRAHHGVCIQFFEGKGYSDGFTRHMAAVIAKLGKDTPVRVVCHADAICSGCPHDLGCECESEDKVCTYDSRVLELCGLSEGDELTYGELRDMVMNNIILPGKLSSVCPNCEWSPICQRAEARLRQKAAEPDSAT